jgi:hypothetical protein
MNRQVAKSQWPMFVDPQRHLGGWCQPLWFLCGKLDAGEIIVVKECDDPETYACFPDQ